MKVVYWVVGGDVLEVFCVIFVIIVVKIDRVEMFFLEKIVMFWYFRRWKIIKDICNGGFFVLLRLSFLLFKFYKESVVERIEEIEELWFINMV